MNENTKAESRIIRLIKSIFKVRTWFDWERVKGATLYLINGIKQLFVPKQATQAESFDEAASKLDINDASLLTKQHALLRLSIVMLISAALVLGYAGYQLFYGSFKAVMVSLVVTAIALTLAFRYHFWYFQIKSRKLGCTFGEWFRQGLLGEKK